MIWLSTTRENEGGGKRREGIGEVGGKRDRERQKEKQNYKLLSNNWGVNNNKQGTLWRDSNTSRFFLQTFEFNYYYHHHY